jgi:hypothetical protein
MVSHRCNALNSSCRFPLALYIFYGPYICYTLETTEMLFFISYRWLFALELNLFNMDSFGTVSSSIFLHVITKTTLPPLFSCTIYML